MDSKQSQSKAEKAVEKIIVKKVRPWVKLSLGLSALGLSYACARQFNLIRDHQTVVEFDLKSIET